jgi:hypothetical protein
VCPGLEPVDLWRWLTVVLEENVRRAQRLDAERLPLLREVDLPDAG